jgi:hypothetical protein
MKQNADDRNLKMELSDFCNDHLEFTKKMNIGITLCMDFKYPLFRMKNIVDEIKMYRYISFKRKIFWNPGIKKNFIVCL